MQKQDEKGIPVVRVAIIGLGDIAAVHLSAISAAREATLVAGCDILPERRPMLPDGVPFYTSYSDMLDREQVDVVHICLPHYLHYPVAKEVAARGYHIFAEKPLCISGEEAADYAQLEERHGVKICLCLQNRCNDTSEQLRELLLGGAYGKVTGVTGVVTWCRTPEYYAAKPWRASWALAGSGVMMNQAIHTLDLLQYFAMSPVRSLRGTVSNLVDFELEVEDTATARIEFESGATGLFMATVANGVDSSVSLEVRCEKAVFTIRDQSLYRWEDGHQVLLVQDDTATAGKACYGNSHQKLIDRFYRTLAGEASGYIPAAEGVVSVRMIEAILESSRTGRPVSL